MSFLRVMIRTFYSHLLIRRSLRDAINAGVIAFCQRPWSVSKNWPYSPVLPGRGRMYPELYRNIAQIPFKYHKIMRTNWIKITILRKWWKKTHRFQLEIGYYVVTILSAIRSMLAITLYANAMHQNNCHGDLL